MICFPRVSLALLTGVLLTGPARAAEVDRFLPGDTEVVLTLNVRQLLDSPLGKKQVVETIKTFLKDHDEVQKVLESLGLDLFKDVDRVTLAAPASPDNDKGLFLVHGRFDKAKFQARAEQAAKDNSDNFRILKEPDGAGGKYTIWEVSLPELQQPLFAALLDKGPFVFSPGKDYVISALNKAAGREKPELKSKALRDLLDKTDPKASLTLSAVGNALAKVLPVDIGPVRATLEKAEAVGAGLTVGDDVKLTAALAARDTAAAKEISDGLTDTLNQVLAVVALAAVKHKQFVPLVEVLKSIKVGLKERVVTIKAEIGADLVEKLLPKGQ